MLVDQAAGGFALRMTPPQSVRTKMLNSSIQSTVRAYLKIEATSVQPSRQNLSHLPPFEQTLQQQVLHFLPLQYTFSVPSFSLTFTFISPLFQKDQQIFFKTLLSFCSLISIKMFLYLLKAFLSSFSILNSGFSSKVTVSDGKIAEKDAMLAKGLSEKQS